MRWVARPETRALRTPPRANSPCVSPPTWRRPAAVSPTARILPPLTATAPGCGWPVERPVQTTPPVMTRSALRPQAARHISNSPGTEKRRDMSGTPSAQSGDATDGLERGERARPLLRLRLARRGERVADVEQHLEQELLALIGGVEVRHARFVPRGVGALVGLAVHGLEVGENAVAGARH